MLASLRYSPLVLVLTVAAACTSGHPQATPSTSTSSVTPTTHAPSTTAPPTTIWHPTSLQPSADAAAALLVRDWSKGDRSAAAAVASPPAVLSLFTAPYPGAALAQSRGCGDTPVVCTYGPNGGANPNDAIYEVYVTHMSGGWFVSAVIVES